MFVDRFHLQSLKSRVSLLTLLVVVLGFLSLGFYTKGLLRDELLLFTGEQQQSALNLLTAEVNHGLQNRLAALKAVASRVPPALLDDRDALKDFLLERSFLAGLFNNSVMILDTQGAVLAEAQFLTEGQIAAGLTPDELAMVLSGAEQVIGRIQIGNANKAPVFAVAVPIRNPMGAVIGALAGVIRLDQPNFLSQLAAHRYGKTGNFFLVEAGQRLIFATSDAKRLMEVLPAAGVSPWIDRFVQGYEGMAQVVNPHGIEVLVSVKQIPLARWYASVTLTPDEAFGLIEAVKLRARLAALLMVLISLAVIWWMLGRQLAPITAAVNILDGFVRQNQAPQALPVVRQDEVGQLVGGFNRLLDALLQQQKVLQDSEALKQAVLNSVTAKIAVLNHDGIILAVNDAWRRCQPICALEHASALPARRDCVGSDFLAACRNIQGDDDANESKAASDGILAVLGGLIPRFYLEFQSQTEPQERWLSMSVTPLEGQFLRGAVVSLEDITERILTEHHVRQLAFNDPLTQLPNRRLALERLNQHLLRARRTKSHLALLFIDLDKFKPINDELGHEVGDWLLQAVAQRILSCVRVSDTAARMGGDEFVVLLPDLQTSDDALAVAEKIRSVLAQEFVTSHGLALSISSSIGVALYPDHGDSDKDLLRRGDEAMYQAKKKGRNAVMLCPPSNTPDSCEIPRDARQSYVHLRWKVAFECGHPVIDDEHRALFQLTNALLDQVPLCEQQPLVFDDAFYQLIDHVTAHFAHEEAILLAQGYEHAAEHALLHQALIRQAHALFLAARVDGLQAAADGKLIHFLVNDLVARHLLQDDRAFFSILTPSL